MAFHRTRVAQNVEAAAAMPRAVINVLPPGRLLVGFTRFSTRSSLSLVRSNEAYRRPSSESTAKRPCLGS